MEKPQGTPPETPLTGRAAAKAERRRQFIDATITCIAKHGLSGTTLAKVTEIAGTSIGLANFHFASKDRLLEAVLTHLSDELRGLWRDRNRAAGRPAADQLLAIVDASFHPRICDRKKLAIWSAFYGDARAREIYRKVVSDVDDERLFATVAILEILVQEGGYAGIDPMETALALESLYDGLWQNMLLYPAEFRRSAARNRVVIVLAAFFPRHFPVTPIPGSEVRL
jgi:TetR/AcrR family transcriptional regulator, transcriptional repressor of bet genes